MSNCFTYPHFFACALQQCNTLHTVCNAKLDMIFHETRSATLERRHLHEHTKNSYCRPGPNVDISWKVSSAAYALVCYFGPALRHFNEPDDRPVGNGVIHYIQSGVRCHLLVARCRVSRLLRIYVLSSCTQNFGLDVQMETQTQRRAGFV